MVPFTAFVVSVAAAGDATVVTTADGGRGRVHRSLSEFAGDRLRPLIRGASGASDIGVDPAAGMVAVPLNREDRWSSGGSGRTEERLSMSRPYSRAAHLAGRCPVLAQISSLPPAAEAYHSAVAFAGNGRT
jgi:hypothetical protein